MLKEEKLEPVKNLTDDPRIRLLNRLYARKRKELQERKALRDKLAAGLMAEAAAAPEDSRSLDDLLSFIDGNKGGGDKGGGGKKKGAKKKGGKKKGGAGGDGAGQDAAPADKAGGKPTGASAGERNGRRARAGSALASLFSRDLPSGGSLQAGEEDLWGVDDVFGEEDAGGDGLDPEMQEQLDREIADFARRLNSDWSARVQEILKLPSDTMPARDSPSTIPSAATLPASSMTRDTTSPSCTSSSLSAPTASSYPMAGPATSAALTSVVKAARPAAEAASVSCPVVDAASVAAADARKVTPAPASTPSSVEDGRTQGPAAGAGPSPTVQCCPVQSAAARSSSAAPSSSTDPTATTAMTATTATTSTTATIATTATAASTSATPPWDEGARAGTVAVAGAPTAAAAARGEAGPGKSPHPGTESGAGRVRGQRDGGTTGVPRSIGSAPVGNERSTQVAGEEGRCGVPASDSHVPDASSKRGEHCRTGPPTAETAASAPRFGAETTAVSLAASPSRGAAAAAALKDLSTNAEQTAPENIPQPLTPASSLSSSLSSSASSSTAATLSSASTRPSSSSAPSSFSAHASAVAAASPQPALHAADARAVSHAPAGNASSLAAVAKPSSAASGCGGTASATTSGPQQSSILTPPVTSTSSPTPAATVPPSTGHASAGTSPTQSAVMAPVTDASMAAAHAHAEALPLLGTTGAPASPSSCEAAHAGLGAAPAATLVATPTATPAATPAAGPGSSVAGPGAGVQTSSAAISHGHPATAGGARAASVDGDVQPGPRPSHAKICASPVGGVIAQPIPSAGASPGSSSSVLPPQAREMATCPTPGPRGIGTSAGTSAGTRAGAGGSGALSNSPIVTGESPPARGVGAGFGAGGAAGDAGLSKKAVGQVAAGGVTVPVPIARGPVQLAIPRELLDVIEAPDIDRWLAARAQAEALARQGGGAPKGGAPTGVAQQGPADGLQESVGLQQRGGPHRAQRGAGMAGLPLVADASSGTRVALLKGHISLTTPSASGSSTVARWQAGAVDALPGLGPGSGLPRRPAGGTASRPCPAGTPPLIASDAMSPSGGLGQAAPRDASRWSRECAADALIAEGGLFLSDRSEIMSCFVGGAEDEEGATAEGVGGVDGRNAGEDAATARERSGSGDVVGLEETLVEEKEPLGKPGPNMTEDGEGVMSANGAARVVPGATGDVAALLPDTLVDALPPLPSPSTVVASLGVAATRTGGAAGMPQGGGSMSPASHVLAREQTVTDGRGSWVPGGGSSQPRESTCGHGGDANGKGTAALHAPGVTLSPSPRLCHGWEASAAQVAEAFQAFLVRAGMAGRIQVRLLPENGGEKGEENGAVPGTDGDVTHASAQGHPDDSSAEERCVCRACLLGTSHAQGNGGVKTESSMGSTGEGTHVPHMQAETAYACNSTSNGVKGAASGITSGKAGQGCRVRRMVCPNACLTVELVVGKRAASPAGP
eukprot:jgi/Mesvir1/21054/Mv16543-RA.3